MRRKLFCFLIFLLAAISFADAIDLPLKSSSLAGFEGSEHNFCGKVTGVKTISEKYQRLEVNIFQCDDRTLIFPEKTVISFYGKVDDAEKLFFSSISFSTILEKPSQQRNPHCFDYGKYLKSKGIFYIGQTEKYELLQGKFSLKEKYKRFLMTGKCRFEKRLNSDTRGFVLGALFGDISALDEDTYNEFRRNGTAHILAVSGLHVGILYGVYKRIFGRRRSIFSMAVLAGLLFSYGTLAMWSPSVTRAVFMVLLSVVANLLDLRYDILTAMSTVAITLIIVNPYVIFGVSFQMSFLAISSIAFIKPVLPVGIPDFMAAATAVYLGLLPYQIWLFNYVSLTAVFVNIPIVYLAGIFVPVSLVRFALFLCGAEPQLLSGVSDGIALLIMKLNHFSSLGGYSAADVISIPTGVLIFIYAFLFFLTSEHCTILLIRKEFAHIGKILSVIILASLICGYFSFTPISKDNIVFVDVGQGDCVHIRCENKDVLIDGGGKENYNVGEKILKEYLMKNQVSNIDLAIATHQHMDHYKGLEELKEVYNVKQLQSGLAAGQTVKLSESVNISTLWPLTVDETQGQDENSRCSVFMIEYDGVKILITGDLDSKGEKEMMDYYQGTDVLKADILKIGHHGSKTSTSDEFLQMVHPQYAVIQVGKNNYGHPSANVIEKCMKMNIIVLRNDLYGAIGFSLSKKKITAHILITGEQ